MSCDPKDEELLTQDGDEHAYKGAPNVQIQVRGPLLPGTRKEGGEAGGGWGKCTVVACAALGTVVGVYMRAPRLLVQSVRFPQSPASLCGELSGSPP